MLQETQTPTWTTVTYIPDEPRLPAGEPALWLGTLGRFASKGKFRYEQVSNHIALHVIEAGRGIMRTGGIDYEVGPGDLFVFFPGQHYRYWDFDHAPWRFAWCWLCGTEAASSLAIAGLTPAQPHLKGDFARALEPLFTEISFMLRESHTPTTYPIATGWRLIDTIERGRERRLPANNANIAALAKSLFDGHFSSTVNVSDLARQLNISRATLFRKFKEAYAVSPKEYLDSLRMERARLLLRDSTATIREIAASCGYEDTHYFSRAFKHATGRTPGDERSRGGGVGDGGRDHR